MGKSLKQQLLEKGGDHSWEVMRISGVLTGEVLLLRLFVSIGDLSYLTHYEPVYQDGELSGILAYIARSVLQGVGVDGPAIRYAEAIYRDEAGSMAVIHRGAGSSAVRALLSDSIPDRKH